MLEVILTKAQAINLYATLGIEVCWELFRYDRKFRLTILLAHSPVTCVAPKDYEYVGFRQGMIVLRKRGTEDVVAYTPAGLQLRPEGEDV